MSSEGEFRKRVQELEAASKSLESKLNGAPAKGCNRILSIVAMLSPIAVWGILWKLQPSFVKMYNGVEYVRDSGKVFMYTIAITVVLWTITYLYIKFYKRSDTSTMLCASI